MGLRLRYISANSLGQFVSYTFFVISFFNNTLLMAYLIFLLCWAFFSGREEKNIESLIWIQIRSLLNPGIAVSFSGTTSILKWGVIFALSLLIFTYKSKYRNRIGKVYFCFIIYTIYLLFSAWIVSSYPTVASFKIMSYIIPFIAIMKGITDTRYIGWMKRTITPLGWLIFLSVFLIPLPVGYLRNGYAFQGFFNHPNVFGVMLSLFLAGYLYLQNQYGIKEIIVSSIIVAFSVMSGSRTGMFSCVVAIMLFVLSKEVRKGAKTKIWVTLTIIVLIIALLLNGSFAEGINNLIFKGHEDSLFYSRVNQIDNNLERFKNSPVLGTGLNVPYREGFTSFKFSFDLVVENGNLALALLGDTGIVGTILFFISYLYVFLRGYENKCLIFILPFVVSMGEQSFFSTNNFGMILYLFISIYLADGLFIKEEKRKIQTGEIEW